MKQPGMTVTIPAQQWEIVEKMFPNLSQAPQQCVSFLIGIACGVMMDRRKAEESRQEREHVHA